MYVACQHLLHQCTWKKWTVSTFSDLHRSPWKILLGRRWQKFRRQGRLQRRRWGKDRKARQGSLQWIGAYWNMCFKNLSEFFENIFGVICSKRGKYSQFHLGGTMNKALSMGYNGFLVPQTPFKQKHIKTTAYLPVNCFLGKPLLIRSFQALSAATSSFYHVV